MSSLHYYILPVIYCCFVFNSNAKDISITADFAAEDIYNAMQDTLSPVHHDVEIDFYLKSNSREEEKLYLSIINPTVDKIIIQDNTAITILGDLIPYTKRTFKHINHVYPITLRPDESRHYHIKVMKQWQVLNFRMNLASENAFIKTTNHDNFFIGIFYGIFFMYMLLLICFYIFSKSKFFTIYILINFFTLLLFFEYNGTGYQYGWFYSTAIQKYIPVVALIGYLAAHISFIRIFFAVQFKNDFSGVVLKVVVFVLVIFNILFFVQLYNKSSGHFDGNISYFIINSLFFVYGCMIIVLCIYTYMESRRREIIWVLIGIFFHIANWMIFINNEFGMIHFLNYLDNLKLFPSNIFVPQLNYFITMFEMFIITIFISINYHNLIRQNNLSTKRLDLLQKININTFVLGQEEERAKITDEIESSISSDIEHLKTSLLNFNTKFEEKKMVPVVLNEIEKTLEDIKNITSNYVAPDMQKMKLEELITTATDKLIVQTDIEYDFSKIPEDYQLNAVANINLYRILQEISNNILKHAEANKVVISTVKDSKTLQVKIMDDGIGFSENSTKGKGIGLMNMESRMNSLNGNCYFMSNEKNGSTIHLIMPLKDIS